MIKMTFITCKSKVRACADVTGSVCNFQLRSLFILEVKCIIVTIENVSVNFVNKCVNMSKTVRLTFSLVDSHK